VDWERRRSALEALRGGAAPEPAVAKLFLIWRALDLRARRPAAFEGAYAPVEAGPGVCAYLRGDEVLVVVPVRDWGESRLAITGSWRDVLTGTERDLGAGVAVPGLVAAHGVALFERA
jgi:(1->4)-alpha-D-glucan 1-alpha-D-glucosylmutase